MKNIKLQINDYNERTALLSALAVSGFKTWIRTFKPEPGNFGAERYYVCFEVADDSVLDEME